MPSGLPFILGIQIYPFLFFQDPIHLRSLFTRAARRHIQYAAWAADGQGVDRHFFGLKRMLKDGEPLPEIYTDPAFGQSNHWELSTSQLSSRYLDGWGYGEGAFFLKNHLLSSLSYGDTNFFPLQWYLMVTVYRIQLEMTISDGQLRA